MSRTAQSDTGNFSKHFNFKDDFLEKERLIFKGDNKFGWREKCEEEEDVEEYMTTTMKQLGLTKARSSVITFFYLAHYFKRILFERMFSI